MKPHNDASPGETQVFIPCKRGVTAPLGFSAAGIKAGIKESGSRDLGVIVSDRPCSAAGVFTTNAVRASCVDWCASVLPSDSIRAVVCNSGNANACTGTRGERDTATVAQTAARTIGGASREVLVAATGIIGRYLPIDRIEEALPKALDQAGRESHADFAEAILTTDTCVKEYALAVRCGNQTFHVGGAAKGAGMIHPNLATMLGFITTDAQCDPACVQKTLRKVVKKTFNNLTVDGDTSTNDMVLMCAGGASGINVQQGRARRLFEEALLHVCDILCQKIAADGEGATKRVEVKMTGAKSAADANKAARAVADSNLVKTAMFGNDPNWGRIVCAIGYSRASFDPGALRVSICGIPVSAGLAPLDFDKQTMAQALRQTVVTIEADLGIGSASAVAHTCDLTYDYIKINAEYHT